MPIFVDFFIGSVANSPNPSTDDDFIVRYGGSGRYTCFYPIERPIGALSGSTGGTGTQVKHISSPIALEYDA